MSDTLASGSSEGGSMAWSALPITSPAPHDALEAEPVAMIDGLSPNSTVGAGQLELDNHAEAPDFEMATTETDMLVSQSTSSHQCPADSS